VLADDVAVRAAGPAPGGFDARRQARSRLYRYRVLASTIRDPFELRTALWWRYPLELELLERCADAVVGHHDFTAFTPAQSEHVLFERTVLRAEWRAERHARHNLAGRGDEASQPGDGILVFEIEAPSFMRNQVRVIVGTMLEVGAGRRSPADFRALLGGAARERAGETAPAHGLCLVAVSY
jgi:tRNA pseudouridine38-40 synthase